MPYLNKQILMGHLGRDPDSRSLASGSYVCNFSVATTESWKDKQTGEWQENTTWHSVSAFGTLAERIGRDFLKGDLIYLEGRTTKRKYTDKGGVEREVTEVKADLVKSFKKREGPAYDQSVGPHKVETPQAQQGFEDSIPF